MNMSSRRCTPVPVASSSRAANRPTSSALSAWWRGGDSLLAPSVTRRLIETYVSQPQLAPKAPPSGIDELTAREREVLGLIAAGLTNAEIAKELHLSPLTAKTHVSRILMKLDARDRVQLVVMAYQSGLIQR